MEVAHLSGPPVESLRVRCPKCTKLYMVQLKDIRETRPRFQCLDCHEKFWISYPANEASTEIVGLRLDQWMMPTATIEETVELAKCPKCTVEIKAGQECCPGCGVIPHKYLALKNSSRIQGSAKLNSLWKKIIDDYGSEDLHREFLKISLAENNLAYASSQYAQLLKLIPQDERASQMIRELEAMVTVPASKAQPIRIQAVQKTTAVWIKALFLIGMTLVLVGVFVPVLRNIIGLGAVLIFLAAAFKLKLFKL